MMSIEFAVCFMMFICFIIGSFSCASAGDGLYPDPSDCSKFFQCAGGREYRKGCAAGLLFNPKSKVCDWPANVQCQ